MKPTESPLRVQHRSPGTTSKDSEPSPLTSLVSRSTNQSLHLGSPEFREPVKTIHRPSGDQLGDELLAWSKDMRSALRTLSFSTSSTDRKSTRLNSSHLVISYAVFCLKKKKTTTTSKHCRYSA